MTSLVRAATERRDSLFLRLDKVLPNIENQDVLWHWSCYKTYTSKWNIACSTNVNTETADQTQHPKQNATVLRSEVTTIDMSLCIFCQRVYANREKSLHTIMDKQVAITIMKTVEDLNDEKMRIRLSGRNLVVSKMKYHKKCHRDYTYKANKVSSTTNKCTAMPTTERPAEDPFAKAFQLLTEEIECGLFTEGKAFSLKYLLKRFTELRNEPDSEQSYYRAKNLQCRLKSHYGDKIMIQVQKGRSKSNIIFSSSITVGQAVSAASALQESFTELSFGCEDDDGLSDSESEQDHDVNANTLYHSAKCLRSALQRIREKKNVQKSQIISNEHVESLIPDSLYMFMRWLLEDDSDRSPISAKKEKCLRPDIHRLILSLSQDLIFACNRNILPPKHIGIDVTVKHLTGCVELIRILNRFGHSISYDKVINLEKGFVQQVLEDNESDDMAIPTNISPGKFVQAAADNLDFNEETLDGKHTTHTTTLVLYQRTQNGKFGLEIKTKVEKDRRPLAELQLNLNDCNFVKHNHKLKLPECLLREEDNAEIECLNKQSAKYFDMAWVFARMCPSKEFQVSLEKVGSQMVPSWTAFNAIITSSSPEVTSIGYCPMIPASPTDYNTVFTVMKTVQKMMKTLGQQHSVITFDEAIYSKAKDIQWRCPEEFKHTVLRLGGFHTAMTFISVIGKRYEESRLEDLLIESGIYGSNSVLRIMNGKAYNKGVRALKLLMEAFCRLRFHSLAPQMTRKSDGVAYMETISKLKDVVSSKDDAVCEEVIREVEHRSKVIDEELSKIRETCKSESGTFAFWDEFIDMIEILLRFIRAEREAIWDLHIDALSEMIPYFFAYDRINYSRWASVYLADMKSLPNTAKSVHDEFMNGNHPVKRAPGTFNQVWTDLALEQSVNRDSKVKGGIVGFTQKTEAVNRWLVTAHKRAAIVSSTKSLIESNDHESGQERELTHKEFGKKRLERDESDVQKLLRVLSEQMLNPFDTKAHQTSSVMNIATNVTATDDVSNDIRTALNVGKTCFDEFVKSRLGNRHEKSIMEPLKKNKLKTLAFHRTPVKLPSRSESSVVSLNADRTFFSRLIVVAKTRSVDLKAVLAHELSPVPMSLAYADSSLRKTQKSKLLHILEAEVTSTEEALPESDTCCVWIYDGMALVQRTKTAMLVTFGDFANLLLGIVLKTFNIKKCDRVDVVFDRYDRTMSIKSSERQRRQRSTGLYLHIHGPQTPLPKQWTKFMDDSRSKANLTSFLCTYWCKIAPARIPEGKSLYIGGGFDDVLMTKRIVVNGVEECHDLFSDQEEADTRMLLHASHAAENCQRIVIDSPDTDVIVLCVYFYRHIQGIQEFYFYTGTGEKRRFVPVHAICLALGPMLSGLMLPFHAITGCDSTSAVGKLGKVRPWQLLRENVTKYKQLSSFGTTLEVSSVTMACAEVFFCEAYGSKLVNVNDVRHDMFCKRFTKTEALPPTQDCLGMHLLRANYQSLIWKTALQLTPGNNDPVGHGWEKDGEAIKPRLMTNPCAPESLLVVVTCSCAKSECKGRCSCKNQGLSCIDACKCGGGEACKNPCKSSTTEDDKDETDDENDGDS